MSCPILLDQANIITDVHQTVRALVRRARAWRVTVRRIRTGNWNKQNSGKIFHFLRPKVHTTHDVLPPFQSEVFVQVIIFQSITEDSPLVSCVLN